MPPTSPALLVVALDGPAGSGKSTLARRLAERLRWAYLDTGAMYRALTVRAMDAGIAPDAEEAVTALARVARIDLDPASGRVTIDGEDVTDRIRTHAVNAAVSLVARIAPVREVMREHQRRFADAHAPIVAEGRDMGTVVFPGAILKVFLLASVAERVRRRVEEIRRTDPDVDAGQVERDLVERDRMDENRETAPLVQDPDAVVYDSTGLAPAKVLDDVHRLVLSRVPPAAGR